MKHIMISQKYQFTADFLCFFQPFPRMTFSIWAWISDNLLMTSAFVWAKRAQECPFISSLERERFTHGHAEEPRKLWCKNSRKTCSEDGKDSTNSNTLLLNGARSLSYKVADGRLLISFKTFIIRLGKELSQQQASRFQRSPHTSGMSVGKSGHRELGSEWLLVIVF